MNQIITHHAEILHTTDGLRNLLAHRKDLFPTNELFNLLSELTEIEASHDALCQIATFIDKQLRKLSTETDNLRRKYKHAEDTEKIDEIRGKTKQISALLSLSRAQKLEIEYKDHLLYLLQKDADITQSLFDLQNKIFKLADGEESSDTNEGTTGQQG